MSGLEANKQLCEDNDPLCDHVEVLAVYIAVCRPPARGSMSFCVQGSGPDPLCV